MADTKSGRQRVQEAVVQQAQRNGADAPAGMEVEVRRNALDAFLLKEGIEAAGRGLAGTGIHPERFLRTVATVVNSSTMKIEADGRAKEQYKSVLVAAMNTATLGLSPAPQVGHVWYVPFWDRDLRAQKLQLIVGYQGFVTLAGRAGWAMKAVPLWRGQERRINIARPEDTFIGPLERVPDADEKPEQMAFVASSPSLMLASVEAKPYGYYLKARERSESWQRDQKNAREGKKTRPGPWTTDELAMVAKTVIRWERKFIPQDPTSGLAAARLAMGFVVDGSVGGAGELPPTDPMEALLWSPDRYDADEPGTAALSIDELSDSSMMAEIAGYAAGGDCNGRDISGDVDAILASYGLDPAKVSPVLTGDGDGPVPPREVLIAVLAMCRQACLEN